MIEMSAVQSALQGSKLLHGYLGEEAELPTWSSFSALCVVQRRLIVTFSFLANFLEVESKVKAYSTGWKITPPDDVSLGVMWFVCGR